MSTLQPNMAGRDNIPVVSLRGLTKRYPGVVANDGISLDFHAGDVHVLLGENGAGKSTLISILSGMTSPDQGDMLIEGEIVRLSSPREALARGIGTVYQHPTLVPSLTVLQNLMLGGSWRSQTVQTATLKKFREFCVLLGTDIDPDARLERLSVGQQQHVEIMKALWRSSKMLILDESTAMLTPKGVDDLLDVVERLRQSGLAIVFITHKLSEAVTFGDRISVIKRGRNAGGIEPEELKTHTQKAITDRIIQMMFGNDTADLPFPPAIPVVAIKPILSARNVSIASLRGEIPVHDISFDLRAGEVLGIAGVEGNGQKLLAEALAGQRQITGGTLTVGDLDVTAASVRERQRRGIRYVTDDRLGEGTIGDFDIGLNMLLKRVGDAPFWKRGLQQRAEIENNATGKVQLFDVRTPGISERVANLSGGNIQKVLLARELSGDPKVVIFNKPTHGLDRNNIAFAHRAIREQAERGVGTIVISTDLDELLALSHRILVMLRGDVIGIVTNGEAARMTVGEMMIGHVSSQPDELLEISA